MAERLIRTAAGFFVTAFVARQIGPAMYGELNFGLALGAIGAGVAQLGMDSILVRDLARAPENAGDILTTSSVLRGAVALVSCAVTVAVLAFWRAGPVTSLAAIAFLSATSVQAVSSVPLFWLQTQRRAWQATAAGAGVFLAASVARVVLAQRQASLVAFGVVAVAEIVAAGGLAFWLTARHVPGPWRYSWPIARELWRSCWPLALAAVAYLGYTRFDQILIGALAGPQQLGLYAAALRLTEQGYLLPAVLATPMLTLIAVEKDAEGRGRQMRNYIGWSALMSYAFVFSVWAIAPFLYRRCFGAGYEEAIGMVRVQALMAPFIGVGYARNQVLISEGMTRFALFAAMFGLVINLGLNVVFIPRFGAIGACWAAVAAQFTSLVLVTWLHPALRWLGRLQIESLLAPWRTLRAPKPLSP